MSLKLKETQPNPYNYGPGFKKIIKDCTIIIKGTREEATAKALKEYDDMLKALKEEYGENFVRYKMKLEGYFRDEMEYRKIGWFECSIPTKPLYGGYKPEVDVKHGINAYKNKRHGINAAHGIDDDNVR